MSLALLRDLLTQFNLKSNHMSAWVIDNDDSNHPDGKKRQRVKYRVPQLHRNIPDEFLPWSNQRNTGSAHAEGTVGHVQIPPIGSKILISHDGNDPHNSYYSSSPPTDDVHANNPLIQDADHPWVTGFKDYAGNIWRQNHKEGKVEVTFTHVSGTVVDIDNSGKVTITSPSPINISSKSDINVVAEGNMSLASKGNMVIASQGTTTISSKGDMTSATSGNMNTSAAANHNMYAGGGSNLTTAGVMNVNAATINENNGGGGAATAPQGPAPAVQVTAGTRPTIDQKQNQTSL